MTIETRKQRPMVRVPAGEHSIGSDEGRADEQPVHGVTLGAFEMDAYVLTVNEVYRLLGPRSEDLPAAWRLHPPGPSDVPATRVCRHEAEAIGHRLGKRLPTEAEFEAAFRCGHERGPRQECHRPGARPFPLMAAEEALGFGLCTGAGLIGMAGVVWQWTGSAYGWYPGPVRTQRPAIPDAWAVVRGGIWSDYDARPSLRSFRDCGAAYARVGVRFVRDTG